MILDDDAYIEIPHSSANIQISSGQKSVPLSVDLSVYCPEVRHQGDISSCVGWAAGYGAMTMERAIKNGWKNRTRITESANSALFVYSQLSDEDCGAIRMPDALRFMQLKGNCLARDFDFDINSCHKTASENHLKKASEYRIEEFVRLFEPNSDPVEKVRTTKLILAQQKPVVIGMKLLNNFYSIQSGDESWFPNIGDQTYAGGHAMVVVGYDDLKFNADRNDIAAETKGAFLIMNSWGKGWGHDGYIWVRYGHFGEYCRHAYALMMSGGDPIDFSLDMSPDSSQEIEESTGRDLRTLAGSFGFKLYTGQWYNNKPLFREQVVSLKNQTYMLENRQLGEQFQLYVTSEYLDGYIYVFSVDPTGKAEVHFPKSEEYNVKFADQNESALLMGTGSTLTVPSEETALTITHQGEDHLIVLFSESKIKPKYIDYLGEQLIGASETPDTKLPRLLKKYMVPFSDILYYPDHMGFEVSTRSEGKIVPIILKVKSD
ncbi:MAG: DUF4384 domain-containing protein [Saprospiraceae bacterium]|nr:DUF4384 domain-containing protein [Saprospiraceae bacterium]